MNEILALTNINFYSLFLSVFVILVGIKTIVSLLEWLFQKLGIETKWMRQKREEHELLIQTSKNLYSLQKKHEEDVQQSIVHDKKIKDELSSFINEMKETIAETQREIRKYAENRVNDRKQSIEIQKELSGAIKNVTKMGNIRDDQINALICGNKELLGSEIDKRYRQYIALNGIPESDVDEFDDIYTAYKNLGGNHSRDVKYSYVKDHLPVIPVKTKLVTKNE